MINDDLEFQNPYFGFFPFVGFFGLITIYFILRIFRYLIKKSIDNSRIHQKKP